ncbi:hypothetical protein ACRALDRAFT_2022120 [Sodiomyces alcalophilus JCM 7366]|uniref:uncharacterized protein n=1 Tax=Sodiomyces alcalophilus JCM 7366 TaxID=591952 RepID=UPI0039B6953B
MGASIPRATSKHRLYPVSDILSLDQTDSLKDCLGTFAEWDPLVVTLSRECRTAKSTEVASPSTLYLLLRGQDGQNRVHMETGSYWATAGTHDVEVTDDSNICSVDVSQATIKSQDAVKRRATPANWRPCPQAAGWPWAEGRRFFGRPERLMKQTDDPPMPSILRCFTTRYVLSISESRGVATRGVSNETTPHSVNVALINLMYLPYYSTSYFVRYRRQPKTTISHSNESTNLLPRKRSFVSFLQIQFLQEQPW